jgi:hypothetical protein
MAGHNEWWKRGQEELEVGRKLKATGNKLQAYHHAGQAVEFALKAIYMRKNGHEELPEACKSANWHNLMLIANEAGLRPDLTALRANNRNAYENWLTVKDWDSNGRFPGSEPSVKALNDMILAITAEPDGMMSWLRDCYQKS